MSTHNLCLEQKYEKYQNCLSENFHFLVVKFSVYLNRHVFIMMKHNLMPHINHQLANKEELQQKNHLGMVSRKTMQCGGGA